jgi:hypothetical protein
MMPGAREVIARRLGSRIRRIGFHRGRLAERALGAERAVHFVGGNLQEAEALLIIGRERREIFARRLEQAVGAHDIGVDEGRGPADGIVHVRLGSEMHKGVHLMLFQKRERERTVADIAHYEGTIHPFQIHAVAGIGECIEYNDPLARGRCLAHEGAADEPGAARDQQGIMHLCHGVRIKGQDSLLLIHGIFAQPFGRGDFRRPRRQSPCP